MMESKYCQLCGQEVQGNGNRLRHTTWPSEKSLLVCSDCFEKSQRCRYCQLPVASDTPLGICPTCLKTKSVCHACGKAIRGSFVHIEGSGAYCKSCYQDRPTCDTCGAPLTDEQWQLSDGRISCAHCHATAIYDPQKASAIYEEMKSVVNQILGLELNIPTGLALVDRKQLSDIIRQQTEHNQNRVGSEDLDPDKTLGIYTRRGMRRGIYVQTGLPRTLLIQIAAHEFAHAWQGENCPLLRDPIVHEGFAEWIAFHVLEYYGYSQQQKNMRQRQDLYGNGLNWALDVEKKAGVNGVINACLMVK